MKATIHEPTECRRSIEIEIPEDDVRRELEVVSKQYARKVSVPGFRKGRTPPAVVQQRFRREIEADVHERLSKEFTWKVIDEHKLVPLHQPVVEELHHKEGEPLTFRATFEIRPEFSLGTYKGLEVERNRPPVTQELIDRNLAGLREQNARFDAVEGRALEAGDVAVVDLQPLDPAGEPAGEPRTGMTLAGSGGGAGRRAAHGHDPGGRLRGDAA